jgi:hypothetical protein
MMIRQFIELPFAFHESAFGLVIVCIPGAINLNVVHFLNMSGEVASMVIRTFEFLFLITQSLVFTLAAIASFASV